MNDAERQRLEELKRLKELRKNDPAKYEEEIKRIREQEKRDEARYQELMQFHRGGVEH